MEYERQDPERTIAHQWKLSVEEVELAVVEHMKKKGADVELLNKLSGGRLIYIEAPFIIYNTKDIDASSYYVYSGETYEPIDKG